MNESITLWFNNLDSGMYGLLLKPFVFLGSELFYISVIPLIFWCINKSLGKRILIISLLSFYINNFIRDLFSNDGSYSMGIVAFWGYLVTWSRKKLTIFVVTLIIILSLANRVIYSGNSAMDILFAIIFSVILIVGFKFFEPKIANKANSVYSLKQRLFIVLFFSTAALVLLIFLGVDDLTQVVAIVGGFAGATSGIILEKELLNFSVEGSLELRILRFIIGYLLMVFIYLGLGFIFNSIGFTGYISVFVRYLTVTFISTYPIPLIFVKFNLAEIFQAKHL